MFALAAALLLASATVSATDRAAIDAATTAIFAPYSRDDAGEAAWDRDIWSRDVRRLIKKWQSVMPDNEPDSLNDGDWLCQCQDWDQKKFRARVLSRIKTGPDSARVTVRIDLGHGERRTTTLTFVREQGRWLIDDMKDKYLAKGLKSAIRQTIAEDEALLRNRP